MKNLRNISINDLRKILKSFGCLHVRYKGGHEVWKKEGLTRPIIFQTHVDPVPEMVIKNIIRDLNVTREVFLEKYEMI